MKGEGERGLPTTDRRTLTRCSWCSASAGDSVPGVSLSRRAFRLKATAHSKAALTGGRPWWPVDLTSFAARVSSAACTQQFSSV